MPDASPIQSSGFKMLELKLTRPTYFQSLPSSTKQRFYVLSALSTSGYFGPTGHIYTVPLKGRTTPWRSLMLQVPFSFSLPSEL